MIIIIDELKERARKRAQLFSEIKGLACSCDFSIRWTCHFCTNLAPKLREILELDQ